MYDKQVEVIYRSGHLKAIIYSQEVISKNIKSKDFTFEILKDEQHYNFRKRDIGSLLILVYKIGEYLLFDEDENL